MAGGCCGTTPDHIAAIGEILSKTEPRTVPVVPVAQRLSGQTVPAFWNSVRHAKPLTIGLNCARSPPCC